MAIKFAGECDTADDKLNICYNIPAIARTLGDAKFIKLFMPIYEKLISDSSTEIRIKAAGAIYYV